MKNHPPIVNSNIENGDKFSQFLGRFSKKNSHLKKRDQQSQLSNTQVTYRNATLIKINKKSDKKNLNYIECYICHKRSYYADKYSNKRSKNQCQFWQSFRLGLKLIRRQIWKFKKSSGFNKSYIFITPPSLISFLSRCSST